jgi:hypothetical protein
MSDRIKLMLKLALATKSAAVPGVQPLNALDPNALPPGPMDETPHPAPGSTPISTLDPKSLQAGQTEAGSLDGQGADLATSKSMVDKGLSAAGTLAGKGMALGKGLMGTPKGPDASAAPGINWSSAPSLSDSSTPVPDAPAPKSLEIPADATPPGPGGGSDADFDKSKAMVDKGLSAAGNVAGKGMALGKGLMGTPAAPEAAAPVASATATATPAPGFMDKMKGWAGEAGNWLQKEKEPALGYLHRGEDAVSNYMGGFKGDPTKWDGAHIGGAIAGGVGAAALLYHLLSSKKKHRQPKMAEVKTAGPGYLNQILSGLGKGKLPRPTPSVNPDISANLAGAGKIGNPGGMGPGTSGPAPAPEFLRGGTTAAGFQARTGAKPAPKPMSEPTESPAEQKPAGDSFGSKRGLIATGGGLAAGTAGAGALVAGQKLHDNSVATTQAQAEAEKAKAESIPGMASNAWEGVKEYGAGFVNGKPWDTSHMVGAGIAGVGAAALLYHLLSSKNDDDSDDE